MSRKIQKPTEPVAYPHGTFLETEKGFFYIHDDTRRWRIISRRVLDSWSPPRVVQTTEAAVSKYRITAKMRFRNGSLIWNLGDGKIYLIENGVRRQVVSPEVFTRLGLDTTKHMKEVMWVSQDEIKLHPLGEDLF